LNHFTVPRTISDLHCKHLRYPCELGLTMPEAPFTLRIETGRVACFDTAIN
jgi:hypothetical protein